MNVSPLRKRSLTYHLIVQLIVTLLVLVQMRSFLPSINIISLLVFSLFLLCRAILIIAKNNFSVLLSSLLGLIMVLAIETILQILVCTRQSSTPKTAYRRYLRTVYHTFNFYEYLPENDSKWVFFASLLSICEPLILIHLFSLISLPGVLNPLWTCAFATKETVEWPTRRTWVL